jgi:hypothetical protein
MNVMGESNTWSVVHEAIISAESISPSCRWLNLPKHHQCVFSRFQRLVPFIRTWCLRVVCFGPSVMRFQARDICAQHRVKDCLADAAKLENERKRSL